MKREIQTPKLHGKTHNIKQTIHHIKQKITAYRDVSIIFPMLVITPHTKESQTDLSSSHGFTLSKI